jgi:hypothetical protein
MIRRDGYVFKKSTRKNKKYDVYKGGNIITSFGDSRYQQYRDKLGLYKNLDHNDEKRKSLYYKRHGGRAEKDSAKYFLVIYLW